ncbi:MAG: hypothetical protein EZS28_009748 [Streblomastix strix]|uniref:NrS-1 polymerase-like helicase domain-containing protein n=1 Tax=Streblomastix strix TaxID=222440 RepID=A0A5J4WJ20_9EUKA|nr:MAG: hypothetical protein EZS28_009748 [Streblomastix strix]
MLKVAPFQNGQCYIIKEYDCINDTNVIHYKNKQAIYDQFRAIRLWQDGKKKITVVDYNQVDEIDYQKIELFIGLVKDTIAANDDRIYEYLLNWFAYIVQKTGKKTETAVILQGLQGIGKNIYINVLSEILADYSAKKITKIDEFVGNLNSFIENTMLAVPNELKNCGEYRTSNMDSMKSIITEGSFRINEKYVPRYEAENVVNLIIETNNMFPIKIENSDRSYVICKCNPVHRGDLEYFTNLCNSFDEDFYNNLFTFQLTRDISSFNPRDIPMTDAKKDIIRASRSQVDDVIIKHFKVFQAGVTTHVAESWKPQDMKIKNYEIVNKNVCNKVKKQTNGVRQYVYQMKEVMVSIYQNLLDDEKNDNIKEQEQNHDGIEYVADKEE